jgi:uncharacterized protein
MKKALVVWGGWDGHEPKQCVDVFIPFLKKEGFDVVVSDNLKSYEDKALMDSLSLVVPCWTMGQISGEQEKGLMDAVKAGVGIAGWHGGMCDSFRNNTGYQWMTGGQFIDHPGGGIDYVVTITDHTDPITAGINDFKIHSEQYYMHVDPGNVVLATSAFDASRCDWIGGTVMPVVWKRMWGKGKVFYASWGHSPADFAGPEALEIMRRGMRWAAR